MREELPREITNEAKVTGIPLEDSPPAAIAGASFEAADAAGADEAAWLERSVPPLLPRRSLITKPSSCSAGTNASRSVKTR
jgi:hypothetical protein